MEIKKGIYQCGINPEVYLYFKGTTHDNDNWIDYYFLTPDKNSLGYPDQEHTACTPCSGRYKPENIIYPCNSFEEAKEAFLQKFPELHL